MREFFKEAREVMTEAKLDVHFKSKTDDDMVVNYKGKHTVGDAPYAGGGKVILNINGSEVEVKNDEKFDRAVGHLADTSLTGERQHPEDIKIVKKFIDAAIKRFDRV